MIDELFKKYDTLISQVYAKLKRSNNPRFEARYYHSLGVAKAAVELAIKNNLSDELIEKAFVAGIIHDYCKYDKFETYQEYNKKYNLGLGLDERFKSIYHSLLAPLIIKEELQITDEVILSAVECHAMGKPNMNVFEKIIYVSDYIEETRIGKHYLVARKIAYKDLENGVKWISRNVLKYLILRNAYVHPKSIDTYNYYAGEVD